MSSIQVPVTLVGGLVQVQVLFSYTVGHGYLLRIMLS